jgi:Family of unknown function (DUF5990)
VAKTAKRQIAMRIVIVDPPAGVVFALQRGKGDLASRATAAGPRLCFDFAVLVDRGTDGRPRLTGEFVQGPPKGKFVYVNSGTLAGQGDSPWTRRAKVGLQSLSFGLLERAAGMSGVVLQARIAGRAKDGGPACATVPLLDGGWTIEAAETAC